MRQTQFMLLNIYVLTKIIIIIVVKHFTLRAHNKTHIVFESAQDKILQNYKILPYFHFMHVYFMQS